METQPPVAPRQPEVARLLFQPQQNHKQRQPQAQARVDELIGLVGLPERVGPEQKGDDGRPDKERDQPRRTVGVSPAPLPVPHDLRCPRLRCHPPQVRRCGVVSLPGLVRAWHAKPLLLILPLREDPTKQGGGFRLPQNWGLGGDLLRLSIIGAGGLYGRGASCWRKCHPLIHPRQRKFAA